MLRSLEITIVAIAVLQILRIALKPPFRRDFAALPLLATAGGLLALALATLGVWSLIRWPALTHVAAVVATAGLAGAWWRARPGYGLRRSWPPGSLGIGASLDAIDNRTFYLDQARVHGPVFKMSQFGRPVVCVLGLARARKVLLDNPDALAPASLPYNRSLPKGALRYMSEEDHRHEGPVFRAAFSSLDLEAVEETIRVACRSSLSDLSAESQRTEGGVRARDWFENWVAIGLSRLFFGLDPGDPRVPEIERVRRTITLDRSGGWRWRRRIEEAFATATALMRDVAGDTSVPLDSALAAMLAADPAGIDNPTRIQNFFLVFRLAVSDVTGLLDWVLAMLTDHPEWRERVAAAPRTTGSRRESQMSDIASRVVLETLRLEQSEFLYRKIGHPMRLDGYSIPAGWLLRICVQESHRDPAIFEDPDRFDPDRFIGRTFGRRQYSPFGADDRGCMGVSLVHFLGRILVEELCQGYQWRLVRDGPLERGSRHRHHWRPSSARRVIAVPSNVPDPRGP